MPKERTVERGDRVIVKPRIWNSRYNRDHYRYPTSPTWQVLFVDADGVATLISPNLGVRTYELTALEKVERP